MITPPWLRSGSEIKIVSPAGKIDKKYILRASDRLRKNEYHVELGEHCLGNYFQFSGTDAERTDDLQNALDDPEINAIICARGGYGTIRIIDQLDFTEFLKYPKWVVGFSDITVLHNRLQLLGIKSVHGPMCLHFGGRERKPSTDLLNLMQILSGEKFTFPIEINSSNRAGEATGILTGGNLSLIYSLTGTPYDLDTKGKILFIEDIGEYLYHIDRMMNSLRLAGKFNSLAGMIVGHFTDIKDNDDPFGATLEELVLNAVRDYDFPVCFGFPAGHEQPNTSLVLGTKYKLSLSDENCSLKMI